MFIIPMELFFSVHERNFKFILNILFTEVLEEALVGNDSEGPLCELLFFFLTAIFQAIAEEEEEVAKEQITDADTKGQNSLLLLIDSSFVALELIFEGYFKIYLDFTVTKYNCSCSPILESYMNNTLSVS